MMGFAVMCDSFIIFLEWGASGVSLSRPHLVGIIETFKLSVSNVMLYDCVAAITVLVMDTTR